MADPRALPRPSVVIAERDFLALVEAIRAADRRWEFDGRPRPYVRDYVWPELQRRGISISFEGQEADSAAS